MGMISQLKVQINGKKSCVQNADEQTHSVPFALFFIFVYKNILWILLQTGYTTSVCSLEEIFTSSCLCKVGFTF